MTCVCIGGGGGCSVSATTTEQYLTGFGYTYDPNDPALSQIEPVLSQYVPAGQGNVTAWKALARACLLARALLYCKTTPGDCGIGGGQVSTSALGSLPAAGQIAGGGLSATTGIASILGVGSTALSAATLGAGVALNVILGIFEHHAAAEQQQATVLCQLCPQASAAIAAVDNAVYAGQITPEQGIAYLQTLASQFKTAVQPFTKTCNAFCGYGAIMSAQAGYASSLYASGIRVGVTGLRVASLPAQTTNYALEGPTYTSPLNQVGNVPLVSSRPLSPSAPVTFYGYAPPGSAESFGGTTPSLATSSDTFLSAIPLWVWLVIAGLVIFGFPGRRAEAEA